MKSIMTSPPVAPDSPGAVLRLIRSGVASSRSDVAKSLGVSATTAGSRVQTLIDHGYLKEDGDGRSHGGRRPRRLTLRPEFGMVAVADLGSQHMSLGFFDMCGTLLVDVTTNMRIAQGPGAVLDEIFKLIDRERRLGPPIPLRGITIGVPGPVDSRTGRVVSPSRMPGWHDVSVRAELATMIELPILVENDANLMAVGEHTATPVDHLVFVKAGTGIGCGVIASGRLHHGAVGAAGDISHLPVPGREQIACSCGRNGCLDAVASGAALVRDLTMAGEPVGEANQVVELAGDGDPTATRLLREAGRATGEILAPVVNFFNPDALVVGGQLSRAQPFVASIRSMLYERCLPMATDTLRILTSQVGPLAGVIGGAHRMIEHLLAPDRVNAAVE
jgi:predicted NBD/HSP70 family sugar kinase